MSRPDGPEQRAAHAEEQSWREEQRLEALDDAAEELSDTLLQISRSSDPSTRAEIFRLSFERDALIEALRGTLLALEATKMLIRSADVRSLADRVIDTAHQVIEDIRA